MSRTCERPKIKRSDGQGCRSGKTNINDVDINLMHKLANHTPFHTYKPPLTQTSYAIQNQIRSKMFLGCC